MSRGGAEHVVKRCITGWNVSGCLLGDKSEGEEGIPRVMNRRRCHLRHLTVIKSHQKSSRKTYCVRVRWA